MNKYILVFVAIFIKLGGFTQPEQYPFFMISRTFSLFSPTINVTDRSLCGIQYSLLINDEKNIKPSLMDKCTNYFSKGQFAKQELFSLSLIIYRQTMHRNLILYWNISPLYNQTYSLINSITFTNLSGTFCSNSSLLSMYGINEGLSAREVNSSQDLLRYEKPVFNASSLYMERVVSDIMKRLKRSENDFSGILKEIIRPSTLPFQ